jgi:hypothetical protein
VSSRPSSKLAFGLLALMLALSACVPPAIVFLNPHYDAQKVKRVALIDLEDFPAMQGSGKIAAGLFEKYLFLGGYSIVESQQVDATLQKLSIPEGASLDLPSLQALGDALGVDALVFGRLTDYSDSSDKTVIVDMPLEQSAPIYGKVVTVQRGPDGLVKTEQDVVTGYSNTSTDTPVQQTETVYAHVGMTMRLVDAHTGDILWSASTSGSGAHLNDATEAASAQIMRSVVAQLKKGQ